MKASIVDLRYKMSEVLAALENRERVEVLYHGKLRGVITPAETKTKAKVSEHPFFGMKIGTKKKVKQFMDELRRGRYHDV